jgi:hypothetical protein
MGRTFSSSDLLEMIRCVCVYVSLFIYLFIHSNIHVQVHLFITNLFIEVTIIRLFIYVFNNILTIWFWSFCGVYGSTGGKRYDVRSSLQQFKDVMAEGNVMLLLFMQWFCGRLYVHTYVRYYSSFFLTFFFSFFLLVYPLFSRLW